MTSSLPLAITFDASVLLVAIVPAVVLALVIAGAFVVGHRSARRARTPGLRELEGALRRLASGRTDVDVTIDADEPTAEALRQVARVAAQLREREEGEPRRLSRLGQASERCGAARFAVVASDLVVVSATNAFADLLEARPSEVEGRMLDELFEGDELDAWLAAIGRARPDDGSVSDAAAVEVSTRGGAPVRAAVAGAWAEGGFRRVVVVAEPSTRVEEADSATDVGSAAEPAPDAGLPAEVATDELARGAAIPFDEVFRALPSGVVVLDGTRILEANAPARAWLGDEIEGRDIVDLVVAEDVLLARARLEDAIRGGAAPAFRCRLAPRGEAGRARQVDVRAQRVGGQRVGGPGERLVSLVWHEVGAPAPEPARSEREIAILATLDAIPDGLVVFSARSGAPEGERFRVAAVNTAFQRLMGVDESRVLGIGEGELAALVAHEFEDPAAWLGLVESTSKEAGDDDEVADVLDLSSRRGGAYEVQVLPVEGPDGEILQRVICVRDVSESRTRERRLASDVAQGERSRSALQSSYEELVRAHQELETRAERAEETRRTLENLDRTRSQLLGDVAHELQTPLVSIRGYTQMIQEGRLGHVNPEQRQGLESVRRNVDRMTEIIGNLLALSRSDSVGETSEPRRWQVKSLLEEAVSRHQPAASGKGVALEASLGGADVELGASGEDFRYVLDNLLSNAIKFTPANGRVVVSFEGSRSGAGVLEVRDSGIGIADEEQERIWERHYRGSTAAGYPGTGLGLSIVREICERVGARFSVNSRQGRGSAFRIVWPAAREESSGSSSGGGASSSPAAS